VPRRLQRPPQPRQARPQRPPTLPGNSRAIYPGAGLESLGLAAYGVQAACTRRAMAALQDISNHYAHGDLLDPSWSGGFGPNNRYRNGR
jgi:hypothetical protein